MPRAGLASMLLSHTPDSEDAKHSSFKGDLDRYVFESPNASPLKREASMDMSMEALPNKRITRSVSRSRVPGLPAVEKTVSQSACPSRSRTAKSSIAKSRRAKSSKARSRPRNTTTTTRAEDAAILAHPNPLADALAPDLLVLFIGVNPGIMTARLGHAYAHPTNLFWRLLHSSGCTPRRCRPDETAALPALYDLGNTNLVARATKDASQLTRTESDAGVAVLEAKVARCRPEAVCIVGKGIWEAIWRVRRGTALRKDDFHYGWQAAQENMGRVSEVSKETTWPGARVFVATSTSGLAAGMRLAEKEVIWRQLGEWVQKRREERASEQSKAQVGSGTANAGKEEA